jgi:hypothetical protein
MAKTFSVSEIKEDFEIAKVRVCVHVLAFVSASGNSLG